MSAPNKERIQLLVDALRSGEYTQGHNQLTTIVDDGVEKDCCLGVACKIAMNNGLPLDRRDAEDRVFYGNEPAVLPEEVRCWYGFDYADPDLQTSDNKILSASALNDKYGYDFQKIADAFEGTYLAK